MYFLRGCLYFISVFCSGIRLHYIRAALFLFICVLYLVEVTYYDYITDEKIGVDLETDCYYDIDQDRYLNGTTVSARCTFLQ